MPTSMEEAVRRLVDRFAPSKSLQQLRVLCHMHKLSLAVAFDESEDAVQEEIMSHLFVDPAQIGLPL